MEHVHIEQQQVVTIDVPPWKAGRTLLEKKIRDFFGENNDLDRVIRSRYFFSSMDHGARLRLATPEELGCPHGVYPWNVSDVAKRNGLQHVGADSIVVRLVMMLEELKPRLPSKYLDVSWWIHMSRIECMTGDKFISGLGCPCAVFNVYPRWNGAQMLSVEWVYQGGREGIEKGQPALFACIS